MGPILACDCPEYSTNITLLGQHEIVFLQIMPRCHAGVSRAQGLIPVGRLDAASSFERMLDLSCIDMTEAVPVNLWVRKSPGPWTCLPFPGFPLFGKPVISCLIPRSFSSQSLGCLQKEAQPLADNMEKKFILSQEMLK